MLSCHTQTRESLDPHGYQPLVVDEHVLSEEDRIEAITSPALKRQDWSSYLTPAEIQAFERAIKEIQRNRSPYWIGPSELPAVEELRFERHRLGVLRAFARDKYADGYGIWFGDKIPFPHGRQRTVDPGCW